jgi:hypothetical protein
MNEAGCGLKAYTKSKVVVVVVVVVVAVITVVVVVVCGDGGGGGDSGNGSSTCGGGGSNCGNTTWNSRNIYILRFEPATHLLHRLLIHFRCS